MGTPQAWGAALSKANQSPPVRRRLGEGGWGRQCGTKSELRDPIVKTVGFFVCKSVTYKSAAFHDLGKSSDFSH